jgi:acyl-CoA synthetase (NDP forming)
MTTTKKKKKKKLNEVKEKKKKKKKIMSVSIMQLELDEKTEREMMEKNCQDKMK